MKKLILIPLLLLTACANHPHGGAVGHSSSVQRQPPVHQPARGEGEYRGDRGDRADRNDRNDRNDRGDQRRKKQERDGERD